MNANAKKWVAALRSGKFKQGKNRLHFIDDDGVSSYCCLGVPCEMYAAEIEIGRVVQDAHTRYSSEVIGKEVTYGGRAGTLPFQVMEWLGIKPSVGNAVTFPAGASPHSLVHANDNHHMSFDQIADLIEEHADYIFRPEGNVETE